MSTELETLVSFWVSHDQFDADNALQSIFTEDLFADPSLLRLITRDGIISHFLFIINNILDSDGSE